MNTRGDFLSKRALLPSSILPRLSSELRVTLTRRMALAAFFITALAWGLHIGWSLYQRHTLETNLRDALARSLQEPLRSHQLPAVRAILQAFEAASQGAEICVKLPAGDWIMQPRCGAAPLEFYSLNLSKDQFAVSVTLPVWDRMVLFGIPFGFAILLTLLLISRYLRGVSGRVLSDLDRLANSPGESIVYYQELAQAGEKIAQGLRLKEENLILAADARIGAIAGLAGHDILTPLATLQELSLGLAEKLPIGRQRVLERVIQTIAEIGEDLLEVGEIAGSQGRGKAIEWPPRSRLAKMPSAVQVAPLVLAMVEENKIQYEQRFELEFVAQIDPKTVGAVAWMEPKGFGRILSNLVNNSVQAIGRGPGRVELHLELAHQKVAVQVRDSGCGISPENLDRIMKKGETFGKANGHGRGLYHAKEQVESWGGTIAIESEPGVGTVVRLMLPLEEEARRPLMDPPGPPDVILIDNDRGVHDGWSLVAEERGLKLVSFDSMAAFLPNSPEMSRTVPIYIDKNGAEDGFEAAAKLSALGFSNLHLTTAQRMSSTGLPHGLRSVVCKRFPKEVATG